MRVMYMSIYIYIYWVNCLMEKEILTLLVVDFSYWTSPISKAIWCGTIGRWSSMDSLTSAESGWEVDDYVMVYGNRLVLELSRFVSPHVVVWSLVFR